MLSTIGLSDFHTIVLTLVLITTFVIFVRCDVYLSVHFLENFFMDVRWSGVALGTFAWVGGSLRGGGSARFGFRFTAGLYFLPQPHPGLAKAKADFCSPESEAHWPRWKVATV